MAPVMPYKRRNKESVWQRERGSLASQYVPKTKHGCIVESHEFTRPRAELSQPKHHEGHIAGRGFTSMNHYNLVHKFTRLPKAIKIPDAKAAVGKEWKKLEIDSSLETGKSSKQKRGHPGGAEKQQWSPLCNIDGYMSSKERGVGAQITKVSRKSRTPWWHCQRWLRRSRLYSQSKDRLLHKWLPQKIMNVIAKLPDCERQAAFAVSACTQVKLDRGRIMQRRYSDCRYWRIWKIWTHQTFCPRRLKAKEVLVTQKKWIICIFCGRWHSKLWEKRLRIPGTHAETWTNRKERGSQRRFSRRSGRVSTCRTRRWRWSPKRFLVYSGWLHLPSSHWTESSTLCAERRNIPCSTEIHWCRKVHTCRLGHCTRKTNWWLLERRWKQKFVRFVDRFHEIYPIERDTFKRFFCGPGRDWQKFKWLHVQIIHGLKLGQELEKAAQRKEKQELALEKLKLEEARNLRGFYCIDPSDEEYKDIIRNVRRKLETPMAAAMPCKRTIAQASNRETVALKSGKAEASQTKTRFSCIAEAHESARPRIESVTKRSYEDHIAGKGQSSVLHDNLVHKFMPMPQAMKIPDAKAAVDKGWKKLETIPAWQFDKVKSKKGGHKRATK